MTTTEPRTAQPIVVLTIDVEPNVRRIFHVHGKSSGLDVAAPALLDVLEQYQVPCTWFVTHDSWGQLDCSHPALVERMAANGEIGCHVHFAEHDHIGNNDRYDTSAGFQRQALENATQALRGRGFSSKVFRGGGGYFDENTLCILEELDYLADSSVFPGGYNRRQAPGLVVDHRQCALWHPYHPSRNDHCAPGDSPLVEVPMFRYPVICWEGKRVRLLAHQNFGLRHLLIDPFYALAKLRAILVHNNRNYPLVFSYHTWDLLPAMETQLANLRRFLELSDTLGIHFSTVSEVARTYSGRRGDLGPGSFSISLGLDLDRLDRLRGTVGHVVRSARRRIGG